MTDTIKTFLETGKLKQSMLTVQLIKSISQNSFIIADKSSVAVLDFQNNPDHAKGIHEGCWYKLIKCQKGEDGSTIKINKLFKLVKTQNKEKIKNISIEVERLKKGLEEKASTKQYTNFKDVSMKPNHTKIDKITVKVLTNSRVISTNKGNYQICNIKDINGDVASINLYSNYLNKLDLYKIFTISNLRKGEVNKDDVTKMRLHTTGSTKIEVGSTDDSLNFNDIGNGDESITGVVIGFGDITLYLSCKKHYKKLDDDSRCPKCEQEVSKDDILEDFRSELYIESINNDMNDEETEVKEIIFFKRAFSEPKNFPQDQVEEKLGELEGKTVKIDYNIDDADKLIAVTIQFP